METKFGKVYIVEREIAVDEIETLKPKLLESVFFSNTNYKFYDSEGKLSPLYKKYEGRPFTIQYNLKQPDKDGNEVEFLAKLNLPYKLGKLPQQDFECVQSINEELKKCWEKHNMLTGNEKADKACRILRDAQSANFIASFCPGWKLTEMKFTLASADPYLILDDFVDRDSSQESMPFKVAQKYYAGLNDLLEGKPVSYDLKNMPDSYIKLIRGAEALREVINKSNQPTKYLLEALRAFHDVFLLQNCREWKQKENDKTSLMYTPTYDDLRLINFGGTLAVEMILYDQGIKIDDRIRGSFLFKSLMRAHGKSCGLVNDLVSLKKEMAAGETSNKAYIFHVKDGLPLEEALQKLVDEINLMTKIVNETGELLVSLYGEYQETQKLVDIVKYTIAVIMQWSGLSHRYHDDVITDCFVDLE